jgi:SAM-dependent methyltransferase
MPKAYASDLAYIHDVGYADHALKSAAGLLVLFRKHGITGGLVVDLGCGSGIWARELVRAGYRVHGVDQSAAMLAIARKRVPEARFQRASLFRARIPQCDAVTSLGECVNFQFDEQNSLQTLAALFRRVHEALRPGGLFIFDIYEPNRYPGPRVRQGHRLGDDWAAMVHTEETATELTRHITSFRRVGRHYRRSFEVHRLRLYPRADVIAELERAGFGASALRRLGGYRFLPARVALVARRREGAGITRDS